KIPNSKSPIPNGEPDINGAQRLFVWNLGFGIWNLYEDIIIRERRPGARPGLENIPKPLMRAAIYCTGQCRHGPVRAEREHSSERPATAQGILRGAGH